MEQIISQLLIIIGILVAVVNIITEVLKKTFEITKPEVINIYVTGTSIILTLFTLAAYWQYNELVVTWYTVLAFIVVGFMVAYAAMFGFDKLLKYFEKIKR